ncbi:YfhE family protein [Pseudalkalibacillus salsuginis]|uniref:YfhE family protein n=1 Tax=Pseudalkalibacillus salsuginis TaxID=2910972 RepID=UPI001F22F5E4|nr:YfhE family protein [Pseudalkalibacillus salsuginis]MCF6409498.1 YfhE family protein [Pseudalkalibacillus salsuginis]
MNPIPTERMSIMGKKTQYQPIRGDGVQLSDAQEVLYAKEFKQADIAGGYRKPRVKEAKRENPDLKQ